MKDAFIIGTEQKLPTVEELVRISETHKHITIHYGFLPLDYISKLTYSLQQCTVDNRQWDKTIFIYPAIHNDKILEKKLELYECAKAFRQDSNYLMGLMASTFGIDLLTLDGLHDLKFKKSDKQRGKLNRNGSITCTEQNANLKI